MRGLALRLAFLGAAAALLAVLGVYALFTDSDTGTGSASAGTVEVKVGPSDEVGDAAVNKTTLVYDGFCDRFNMKPDDSCLTNVRIFNTGSLAFSYTLSPYVNSQGPGPDALLCWDIAFSGATTGTVNPDDVSDPVTITVTMLNNNDCQGKEANLGMEVIATQWP